MGHELYESNAAAKAVFDEVDEALNQKLSNIIFNGPMEELTLTANIEMVKKEPIDDAINSAQVLNVGIQNLVSKAVGSFASKLGGFKF